MDENVITDLNLAGELPLLARGKVRDLYEIDSGTLLMVASDRISAYDVIMQNGIPKKGALITLLSEWWFRFLSKSIPNLQTHFLSLNLPTQLSGNVRRQLKHRSMLVQRLPVFKIEAIVRGYITGSAWKEYQAQGTVHGIKVKPGLQESEAFPQGPLYTPSTKAEAGKNDENIHPTEAAKIVGEKYAKRIEELALKLYKCAHEYAIGRGIIIADTKFEFGLEAATDEIVLVDEVLTPDSSRFWPASSYEVGKTQSSFDKQYLRDWLVNRNLKGKQGVEMPVDVVRNTEARYIEAFEKLVVKSWAEALTN
ncbi:Bifunctional purine biosynthetic protein ade1 [Loxospora ochrophaea]|nr:Bifunctional purine biosynthetic protein ade1 [Loxospora ochrophaea]